MSINKVLNRPMFRKEALKQGVLKPIKARVGQYIQQGPLMQQGPGVAPGPYSVVPLTQQGPMPKSFSYNQRTGEYITDYGKKALPRKFGRGLRGLGAIGAMYETAGQFGFPEPLLQGAAAVEAASIPFAVGRGATSQTIARTLSAPSRFAYNNPATAFGLGALSLTTGGTKSYFDEKELVRDYAKRNDISYRKAMDIFNRDLVGTGGRPIGSPSKLFTDGEMRKSDIGKMILGMNPAVGSYIRSGLKDTAPGGLPGQPTTVRGSKSEKEIASEMRNYMDLSKQYGRYFQDVDELVKKVKNKERIATQNRESLMMSPDDAMQIDQATIQDDVNVQLAKQELRNAIMAQHNTTQARAENIAISVLEGDMDRSMIKAAAENDNIYETVPNYVNDPNHKEAIKMAKAEDTVEKKIEEQDTGTGTDTNKNVDDPPVETGDPQIDDAKKLATEVDISEFLRNPRVNETDPTKVFLLKLAAGLLSGKTTKGGLGGAAEVLGAALGPAIDAQTLVKMKNDEAYRDWASTVLNYNAALYKARNDAITKTNFLPGAFQTRDGQFLEARRDKNTGEVVVVNPDGTQSLVDAQMGQFYEQKQDAKYFDNLKLISDGYMSTRLLQDSIALMETQKGKTAIGASGLITNLVDIVSKIPEELRDGLFSGGTFSQSNIKEGEVYEGRGLRKFEDFEESTNRVLGELEDGLTKYFREQQVNATDEDGKLATAADVLGKLRVNARMLTYSLANSLKEKDRLTNRDLELIEDLTRTLTTGMTDDKIIAQYKELLKEVSRKNKIRIAQLGTMGYTQADIDGLLGSSGLGVYNEPRVRQKQEIKTLQDAFDNLMGIQ